MSGFLKAIPAFEEAGPCLFQGEKQKRRTMNRSQKHISSQSLGQNLSGCLKQLKDIRGRSYENGDVLRPGLIVLDLMNLFCDRDSPAYLPEFAHISENIFSLVRLMNDRNRPVVFSRHVHDHDDSGGLIKRFFGRLQYREDPLSQLIPAVSEFTPPAKIMDKQRHSALLEPLIQSAFLNCDSLIIAGIQTHLCVLSTAIDCVRCGFVPIVPIDATTARSSRLHLDSLHILGSGHSFVWTVEEIEKRMPEKEKTEH